MSENNKCIILLPKIADNGKWRNLQQDIIPNFQHAIEFAGLQLTSLWPNGVEITEESLRDRQLVKEIHEASCIIIDITCYEPQSFYPYSPYLYYFIGFTHSFKERAIFITIEDNRIPRAFDYGLQVHYNANSFAQDFKKAVQGIQDKNISGSNIIQHYFTERLSKEVQDQLKDVQDQVEEKHKLVEEQIKEIDRLKEQNAQLEQIQKILKDQQKEINLLKTQNKQLKKQENDRITFTKIS